MSRELDKVLAGQARVHAKKVRREIKETLKFLGAGHPFDVTYEPEIAKQFKDWRFRVVESTNIYGYSATIYAQEAENEGL